MPPQDQAEIEAVKVALRDHQAWIRREGGGRADLSFRDLSGLDLRGADLSGAALAGVNLAGAKLMAVDLTRADLFGADLEGADLTGATLLAADLRGANLHRAALTDTVLTGADLRPGTLMSDGGHTRVADGATRLTEARMERSILAGAKLTGCDLSGAVLTDADLSGVELTSAILIGADLSGAHLEGVTLGDTVVDAATKERIYFPHDLPSGSLAEPTYAVMAAETFLDALDAHERWTRENDPTGKRLDLDLVEVRGVDLRGRTLAGARLRRCRLLEADARGADLKMADLSYSDLSGIDLGDSVLDGTTFRRATLARARLTGARTATVPLSGERSWPTNFDGADLTGADLSGIDLEAAVGSARLDGARLGDGTVMPILPPPPRPVVPTERRRHRRYSRPVFTVTGPNGEYRTRNWSLGGLCLAVGDEAADFEVGRKLKLEIRMRLINEPDARATAEAVVVFACPIRGQSSLRFSRQNAGLRALLKRAFAVYRKMAGM